MDSFDFYSWNFWNPSSLESNREIDKLGTELIWYYIGTGLFLGIITLMDDGIELALGFHAANNLVTAILVTASWTAFQTESILIDNSEPSLGKELFITLLIIYPISPISHHNFCKKISMEKLEKTIIKFIWVIISHYTIIRNLIKLNGFHF